MSGTRQIIARFAKAALVVAPLALAAGAASATPLCATSASLASYIALGSGGCIVGDKIFSNFVYTVNPGGPLPAATGVTVVPVMPSPSIEGLEFESTWTANPGILADFSLSYNVRTKNGHATIEDASISASANAIAGTGGVGISENLLGTTSSGLSWNQTNNNPPTGTFHTTFTPVSSLTASKDVGIVGITGFEDLSIITQEFSQVTTPEPAALAVLGLGMLGLAGVRFRRSRG